MTPKALEVRVIIHGSSPVHPRRWGVILAERFSLIHLRMNRSEGFVCHEITFSSFPGRFGQ
jgi:hypothetical protein